MVDVLKTILFFVQGVQIPWAGIGVWVVVNFPIVQKDVFKCSAILHSKLDYSILVETKEYELPSFEKKKKKRKRCTALAENNKVKPNSLRTASGNIIVSLLLIKMFLNIWRSNVAELLLYAVTLFFFFFFFFK